jgi:hypothetical protein
VKAGPELDLKVAEKVMGYQRKGALGGVLQTPWGEVLPYCPAFSSDPKEAMKVISKLKEKWTEIHIDWDGEDGCWAVYPQSRRNSLPAGMDHSFEVAVCIAALQAYGVEVKI